jgi:hypothetical protein
MLLSSFKCLDNFGLELFSDQPNDASLINVSEEPSRIVGFKGLSSDGFGKAELIGCPLLNVLAFHE